MKIIAYDDNPDFGGHQIMACHGLEALAADPSIDLSFVLNPSNEKLVARLHEAGIPVCAAKEKWPVPNPDLVLCIQGDIAQSARRLKTARNNGIECISYLALPHTMVETGARLGALRDYIHAHDINRPDRYITISDGMKQKLISRGCIRPVDVVPNGIEMPENPPRNQRDITPPSSCTLGHAGRIEFKQKQQDFIIKVFSKHPEAVRGCRLWMAGNGPDEHALCNRIDGMENISVMPWQQDMNTFYDQIDVLVIPSRYEGVPLVMLEALARGIPVIGSAVDGMKEILPEEWTFSPGDGEAFIRALDTVRVSWKNDIARLQQHVRNNHSLEAFKANFVSAVCDR